MKFAVWSFSANLSNVMASVPYSIGLYFRLIKRINRSQQRVKPFFKGILLGILTRRKLRQIDEIYYQQKISEKEKDYCDETYNTQGFFHWERQAIMKYFQASQTILVSAFGGGREVVALSEIGYDVDGFECNPQLFASAQQLFKKNNIEGNFQLVSPDECLKSGKVYDGAIIGWGSYMSIQGRKNRVEFLKQFRAQLETGSPLLVSFFIRLPDDIYFQRLQTTGNFFRKLLFRERLELGDALGNIYLHWFTPAEIESELREAGFLVKEFSNKEYGHAVAVAV